MRLDRKARLMLTTEKSTQTISEQQHCVLHHEPVSTMLLLKQNYSVDQSFARTLKQGQYNWRRL